MSPNRPLILPQNNKMIQHIPPHKIMMASVQKIAIAISHSCYFLPNIRPHTKFHPIWPNRMKDIEAKEIRYWLVLFGRFFFGNGRSHFKLILCRCSLVHIEI